MSRVVIRRQIFQAEEPVAGPDMAVLGERLWGLQGRLEMGDSSSKSDQESHAASRLRLSISCMRSVCKRPRSYVRATA